MKKILSLALSLIMLFSVASYAPFTGYALNGEIGEIILDNPYYSGRSVQTSKVSSYSTSLLSDVTDDSNSAKYNGVTYYGKGKQLYTQIKNQLVARKTTFNVHYLSGSGLYFSASIRNLLDELFENSTSDEISTSTVDGDYIRWQVGTYGIVSGTIDEISDGNYYYTLSMQFEYYDTAKQESKITSIVNSVVSSIQSQKLSDYDTLKAVHDFVCDSTTYDYNYASRSDYYDYSPYGALVSGRCVCQGYALAFYRIAKELGYNSRVVSSDPDKGCHAWNIVQIDGLYYFVDCTWDDDDDENTSYDLFLVNYSNIQRKDSLNSEHKLYDKLYDNTYFNKTYKNKFSSTNYDQKADNLSNSKVSLSSVSYTYNNCAYTPSVKVVSNQGKVLTQDVDYTIKYVSNKNAGTAFVTINGAGDYSGQSTKRSFTINCATIKSSWVSLATTTYTYNGSYIKPVPTVSNITSSDYSLSWASNKYAGVAKVTVNGKGNYKGSVSKTFYINPSKVTSLTVQSKNRTSSSLTLEWKKQPNVTGYKIQQYKGDQWVTVKTIASASTNSCKLSLSPATKYKFRVRAYKTTSAKTLFGAYSSVYITCTKPKNVSITSLATSSKSMAINWKKVQCSGYQIQYSTKSDFSSAKSFVVSSSKTIAKVPSLTKGKKYYVRIRAYKSYKNASGKTVKYYSDWSGKKSITVK